MVMEAKSSKVQSRQCLLLL